jgi:CheY-like chemotaxis protein
VGQGTGLGLSTVYGIVKQSSGFVWAYSEPGMGSSFKVYLPRFATPDGTPSQVRPPEPARKSTETILVAEDEDMVRELTCRVLRDFGYTVLEARDGVEALKLMDQRGRPVDLVVSDVVMPEMGGRELGERLRQLWPTLPVLYVSGYTGEDIVQRGLLDPTAPFQQKPFTPFGLAGHVRELLDRRAASAATNGGPPTAATAAGTEGS